MKRRILRPLYTGAVILYAAAWIVVMLHFTSIRRSQFAQSIYGSKIEGGHFYFRINKDREEYKQVTAEQYERIVQSNNNSSAAIFGGLFGFVLFILGGAKFQMLPGEMK